MKTQQYLVPLEPHYYAYIIPATGETGTTTDHKLIRQKIATYREVRYYRFKTQYAAEGWLAIGAPWLNGRKKKKTNKREQMPAQPRQLPLI